MVSTAFGFRRHEAFSLVELLAAVTVLAVLAVMVIPRIVGSATDASNSACHVNQGEIEIQAQLWYRNTDAWPAADLGDIGSDPDYFPEGLPTCPVDGTPYTLDPVTHEVVGHDHS
jgi:prepilin-type N-terminal cleavage/methylation domain-containing protein